MKDNQKTIIALKKAQASLAKVLKMIENQAYCVDIIQQNLAVIGLLRSANSQMLQTHLRCCFSQAAKKGGRELEEKMLELLKVINIAQSK